MSRLIALWITGDLTGADSAHCCAWRIRCARRGELDEGAEEAVREELRRYSEKALGSDAPLIGDERRAGRAIGAAPPRVGPPPPPPCHPPPPGVLGKRPPRGF